MVRWGEEIKKAVVDRRLIGATYGEILREFAVPKSTLSEWFKDIPKPAHLYFTNQKSWLAKIRKLSVVAKKKKSELKLQQIAEKTLAEVNSWNFLGSNDVQKAFLCLLYWAEGQKLPLKSAPVKFANTDPRLVLLFLTMLRRCYKIDESKLRVRLYMHWYHNKAVVKNFWRKVLDIDEGRFTKIHLKRRSKTKRFRKNFAGICFLSYQSIDLRREIVNTGYNIGEAVTGRRLGTFPNFSRS